MTSQLECRHQDTGLHATTLIAILEKLTVRME